MTPSSAVFARDRWNAIVVYATAAVLVVLGGLQLGRDELLWVAFAAFALVLALAPTVATRDPYRVVPGELAALAAVPVVVSVLDAGSLVTQVTTYLAVVALALLFTVELATFTPVEMPLRVAVPFVVPSAMAVAGAWMVVQWLSDRYLGTTLVGSVPGVMWEFAVATAAAAVAGPAVAVYFNPDDALGGDGGQ
jgi:hypothetical protein